MDNKKIYYFIIPVIIVIIWFLISYLALISPIFLPSPQVVFLKIIELYATGEILPDIFFTLYRVFSVLLLHA